MRSSPRRAPTGYRSPGQASEQRLSLHAMRAAQITEFGGPEVLTVVDVPEPEAGADQKVYDVSTAGVNYADTHHRL